MHQYLNQIKTNWGHLVKFAIWTTGMIGAFLTLPAQATINQSNTAMVLFLQFIATILLVLFYRLAKSRSKKRKASTQITAFIALLIITLIGLFYSYYYFQQKWTCAFAGKHLLVIGNTYTTDAEEFIKKKFQYPPSCQELLAEYASDNLAIWNGNEIMLRHMILAVLFSLLWLVSASAMMAATDIVQDFPGKRKINL